MSCNAECWKNLGQQKAPSLGINYNDGNASKCDRDKQNSPLHFGIMQLVAAFFTPSFYSQQQPHVQKMNSHFLLLSLPTLKWALWEQKKRCVFQIVGKLAGLNLNTDFFGVIPAHLNSQPWIGKKKQRRSSLFSGWILLLF